MIQPAPIALFTYNRLWHTQQTVESLQRNTGSAESDLIIFSDGPKNESARSKVDEVRKYLGTITGFKSVQIIEQQQNKGLARSIIAGVSQVVNDFERVIVLEDDMITSPYFLTYMNEGLSLYQNEQNLACIHGYRYPIGQTENPFFVRGADCWGWATWKRAWDLFREDGNALLQELKSRKLIDEFNHQNSFPYDKMLKDQILGKNDSWAIRWKASAFLNAHYTLYPKESMVRNIGNDDSGTHSQTTNHFDVELAQSYEGLKVQRIEEDPEVMARIAAFYRKIRPTIAQRVAAKFFK